MEIYIKCLGTNGPELFMKYNITMGTRPSNKFKIILWWNLTSCIVARVSWNNLLRIKIELYVTNDRIEIRAGILILKDI